MTTRVRSIGMLVLAFASVAVTAAAEVPRLGQPAPAAWLERARRAQVPVALGMVPGLAAVGGEWVEGYGGTGEDEAALLRVTSDGGYVFGGTTSSFGGTNTRLWLFKTDDTGTVLWSKAFSGPSSVVGSFAATPDGGYAASGTYSTGLTSSNLFVAKFDANGALSWAVQLGSLGTGAGSAQVMPDNGFLVYGYSYDPLAMQSTLLLIRLNSSGGIVWQTQWVTPQFVIAYPTLLANGNILLLGSVTSADFSSTDAFVMLANSTGVSQWQRILSGPASEGLFTVVPASDGGYLLTGNATTVTTTSQSTAGDSAADGGPDQALATTTTSKILIVKLNSVGNLVWQETVGGLGADFGFLTAATDGNYYLSGSIAPSDPANEDILLAEMNGNGGLVWSKAIGGNGTDYGIALPDPTGGIFMVGSTSSTGTSLTAEGAPLATGGQDDGLVAHFGSTGGTDWMVSYGGANDDYIMSSERLGYPSPTPFAMPIGSAASIGALATGDLFLSGETKSYGAGGTDVWAAHLDSHGQIAGSCQFVHPISLASQSLSLVPAASLLTVTSGTMTASNPGRTAASLSLTSANVTPTTTDLCTAQAALSATASASATSGGAPLTVNFTGQAANGTPPYTWQWNFGDGSAVSTQQNPVHVYAAPGVYAVTLTVHDNAGGTATDSHLSITVTGGGGCSLSCTATVPVGGTQGTPIAFAATANASGCAGSPTYLWDFGDNTTPSVTQNPTHTYAQAGTYTWTLTVVAGTGFCSKTGSITISPTSAYPPAFVAGVAHAQGDKGSVWRTNLAVANRSNSSSTLTLTYVPYGGGTPVVKSATLGGYDTIEWQDVLVSLFGVSASASVKGTVKIETTRQIAAVARTFNQSSSGTFGQYLPVISQGQELTKGVTGYIPLLKNNAGFRSNIGLLNTGTAAVTVSIVLHGANGAQVGSTKSQSVDAGQYWQLDNAFTALGAGTQNTAYATVTITSPSGSIWAFGSVVDNATNDPTTVPVLISPSTGPFYVAGIAHASGALSSVWRSNIAVVYPGPGSTVNVTLTYVPYGGGASVVKTVGMTPGSTVEWQDLLVSLFGFAASSSIKGTVWISCPQPIVAVARTYNQGTAGTFGQYLPAIDVPQALAGGAIGYIPLVKNNAAFRSNIGILNVGAATCTVRIKLFNGSGTQVGSTKDQAVSPGQYWQQDNAFTAFGAGTQDLAYATVEVLTASGNVWAFGSVVDNGTNDPTTVPVVK